MMKLVKIGKSSIKVNKKMWKTVKLTKNFFSGCQQHKKWSMSTIRAQKIAKKNL